MPVRYVNGFAAVLSPDESGGFTATCVGLPGCISEGDSLEEALANIREAIELYLETAMEVFPDTDA